MNPCLPEMAEMFWNTNACKVLHSDFDHSLVCLKWKKVCLCLLTSYLGGPPTKEGFVNKVLFSRKALSPN